MHVVVQQYVDKCAVTFRPDNSPAGQQLPVFERITRIPGELVRMRGIEHIGHSMSRQRLTDLVRNGFRFGYFDHKRWNISYSAE